MTTGATMNRHRSVQDVETPRDLLDAVEARFGKLTADLACTRANAKAPDAYTESDTFRPPAVERSSLVSIRHLRSAPSGRRGARDGR